MTLKAMLISCAAVVLTGHADPLMAGPQEENQPQAGRSALPVRLVRTGERYGLKRGGKPYFIRGAGGREHLEELRSAGGNSVRTWGTDELDSVLDHAHRLGLSVAVGLWLGQARHGFSYDDKSAVDDQFARIRETVQRFRDHPAVLLWGIGNEMESDSPHPKLVWREVDRIASTIKQIDPLHPTMTVVAEITKEKVEALHSACPNVDVIGINSYGGMSSLPRRYREAGGKKPFIVTEFGSMGPWEVPRTSWGAPLEPSSTEKARKVLRDYTSSVVGEKDLCLGSYAFLWGQKQEQTETWFGMFLKDGTSLGAVDVLTELWKGQPAANRAPEILSFGSGAELNRVESGQKVSTEGRARDPDGDPLSARFVVKSEAGGIRTGGDEQPEPESHFGTILSSSGLSVRWRAPKEEGSYRLFAYVRDGRGKGATANQPFLVRNERGKKVTLPLVVYGDPDGGIAHYSPSGWIGNRDFLDLDLSYPTGARSGATCLRVRYDGEGGWAGVAWLDGGWGDHAGGLDLHGAERLSFWVRGEKGGERVEFKLGILEEAGPFSDSASATTGIIELTRAWEKHLLSLAGKDLRRIKSGFASIVAGQGRPITFFVDDVRYE